MTIIDRAWLSRHPLPTIGAGLDKQKRGQVLVVGGSQTVPGAALLTGEAALRTGAGKVQIASIDENVRAIGIAFPECAVIGLPATEDGEVGGKTQLLDRSAAASNVVVIGPGMSRSEVLPGLLRDLFEAADPEGCVVLDAAAIQPLSRGVEIPTERRCVITPHPGEMARLFEISSDEVEQNPERFAREAAKRFGVIVVLKSSMTIIATGDGSVLEFESPAAGLGTAGSGDVLAGVIGGLIARGTPALDAAAWGVWLHGQAGCRVGKRMGEIGYLARDLLSELPALVSDA